MSAVKCDQLLHGEGAQCEMFGRLRLDTLRELLIILDLREDTHEKSLKEKRAFVG